MRVMLGNVLTVDDMVLTVIAEVESLLHSPPLVYGGSSSSQMAPQPVANDTTEGTCVEETLLSS